MNVGDAQSVTYIHALMYMIHDKIYVGIDISIGIINSYFCIFIYV